MNTSSIEFMVVEILLFPVKVLVTAKYRAWKYTGAHAGHIIEKAGGCILVEEYGQLKQ